MELLCLGSVDRVNLLVFRICFLGEFIRNILGVGVGFLHIMYCMEYVLKVRTV